MGKLECGRVLGIPSHEVALCAVFTTHVSHGSERSFRGDEVA